MNPFKNMHIFAVKYKKLYDSPETVGYMLEERFADQCKALGFVMDCGKSFCRAYPADALSHSSGLARIIRTVTDAKLLGSAIFSRWRYVTHWSQESLLDENNRPWFQLAFARLAELTGQEHVLWQAPFSGQLRQIKLCSYACHFVPYWPEQDMEQEQRLTVTAKGMVYVTQYNLCRGDMKLSAKGQFSIGTAAAGKVMNAFAEYFSRDRIFDWAMDIGGWELVLTNGEGRRFYYDGSFLQALETKEGDLSDLLRREVGRNDLWAFDGNPEWISKVDVVYRRKDGPCEETERLVVDGTTETIVYEKTDWQGFRTRQSYCRPCKVSRCLKIWDINALSKRRDDLPEAVPSERSERQYELTICTNYGKIRRVQGDFDALELPADWAERIEEIHSLLCEGLQGDLFESKLYKKGKRSPFDYIFCYVSFQAGGQQYCYLADKDEYEIGDFVIVPVGEEGQEKRVRIERIEYLPAEKAPFPLDKIKHIIRKA